MDASELELLETLFAETRLFFHLLREIADDIHKGIGITAAMRGVMEGLELSGPQTVPAMARIRPVSRQHIQTIVNELLKRKLVEEQGNPAHKGSPLIALTPEGSKIIRNVKRRERAILEKLKPPTSKKQLAAAAESISSVRKFLATQDWKATEGNHETR